MWQDIPEAGLRLWIPLLEEVSMTGERTAFSTEFKTDFFKGKEEKKSENEMENGIYTLQETNMDVLIQELV